MTDYARRIQPPSHGLDRLTWIEYVRQDTRLYPLTQRVAFAALEIADADAWPRAPRPQHVADHMGVTRQRITSGYHDRTKAKDQPGVKREPEGWSQLLALGYINKMPSSVRSHRWEFAVPTIARRYN